MKLVILDVPVIINGNPDVQHRNIAVGKRDGRGDDNDVFFYVENMSEFMNLKSLSPMYNTEEFIIAPIDNTHSLYIKAHTNSDWDSADIFEVDFDALRDAQWYAQIGRSIAEIGKLINSTGIVTEAYGNFGEFRESSVCHNELALEYEGYGAIMMADNTYSMGTSGMSEEFQKPENTIDSASIKICEYGVSFCAYGKHTGDEFFTEKISHSQLENTDTGEPQDLHWVARTLMEKISQNTAFEPNLSLDEFYNQYYDELAEIERNQIINLLKRF